MGSLKHDFFPVKNASTKEISCSQSSLTGIDSMFHVVQLLEGVEAVSPEDSSVAKGTSGPSGDGSHHDGGQHYAQALHDLR